MFFWFFSQMAKCIRNCKWKSAHWDAAQQSGNTLPTLVLKALCYACIPCFPTPTHLIQMKGLALKLWKRYRRLMKNLSFVLKQKIWKTYREVCLEDQSWEMHPTTSRLSLCTNKILILSSDKLNIQVTKRQHLCIDFVKIWSPTEKVRSSRMPWVFFFFTQSTVMRHRTYFDKKKSILMV